MLLPVDRTASIPFSEIPLVRRAVLATRSGLPWLVALGGLCVLAFLLLWRQSAWNLQDWDEARHVVSALEMLRSGDWLVNTYMGTPDLWNLKPPVSFWAIAASMSVFGATPFAMHLPSVVATLGTAVVCWNFARRHAGLWAGAFTVLAIASCGPLINAHTGRTADPDAIYLLALTVAVTAAIDAVHKPRWLVLATSAFSVAFLTKSWHALLALAFVAVVAGALVVRRRARIRDLAVAVSGFLPVVIWVAARFAADGTRFLVPMVQYDLLSRTGSTLEGHYQTKTFYLDQVQGAIGLWLAAGALGIGLHLAARDRSDSVPAKNQGWTLALLFGWTASVLVAFTMASTKLFWYVAPVYPAAALLSGIGVGLGLKAAADRRPLLLLVPGLAAVAFMVGAQDLRVAISTTSDNPAQLALVAVGGLPGAQGARVYLDPSVGGWSQSLVAVAEARGLTPVQAALPAHPAPNSLVMIAGDPRASASGSHVSRGEPLLTLGSLSAYAVGN